jgi:hypothetical protein
MIVKIILTNINTIVLILITFLIIIGLLYIGYNYKLKVNSQNIDYSICVQEENKIGEYTFSDDVILDDTLNTISCPIYNAELLSQDGPNQTYGTDNNKITFNPIEIFTIDTNYNKILSTPNPNYYSKKII